MAVRLELAVRGLFATPVAALEVPGAERLDAAPAGAIGRRRAEHGSVQASDAGGRHPDRDLLAWDGPAAAEVIDLADGTAAQLAADRPGAPTRPAWRVAARANVDASGHARVAHRHAGASWSGTYHVDGGGRAADPSLGGGFETLDPPCPGMRAPHLESAGDGASETVRPKPGLPILFLSRLLHRLRPHRGADARTLVAFDSSLPARRP